MNNRLIFISYSDQDERWKKLLMKQLGVLEMQGSLEVWENSKIRAGQYRLEEINEKLQNATVAILLVSADFLSSELIREAEIKQILERRASEKLGMFPIIVSDCVYQQVKWLAKMQVRPKEGALDQKRKSQVATELKNIVLEVIALLSPDESLEPQGEPPPERAKVEPHQKPVPAATPRESDPLQALEEKAATDPDLRRKLYDMASRLKTKGQPTSGPVTFYQEGSDKPVDETTPKTSGLDFKAQVPGGQVNAK